jgi:hypothetical protein
MRQSITAAAGKEFEFTTGWLCDNGFASRLRVRLFRPGWRFSWVCRRRASRPQNHCLELVEGPVQSVERLLQRRDCSPRLRTFWANVRSASPDHLHFQFDVSSHGADLREHRVQIFGDLTYVRCPLALDVIAHLTGFKICPSVRVLSPNFGQQTTARD